jgi:formate dehydrogenase subunit gamma
MEGAFEAMGEGTVDVNWAKEHHSLWLNNVARAANPAMQHPVRRSLQENERSEKRQRY